MLPPMKQIPESVAKEWHDPDDIQEPKYIKGMKATARYHNLRRRSHLLGALAAGAVLGGALMFLPYYAWVGVSGLLLALWGSQTVATLRSHTAMHEINRDIERGIKIIEPAKEGG